MAEKRNSMMVSLFLFFALFTQIISNVLSIDHVLSITEDGQNYRKYNAIGIPRKTSLGAVPLCDTVTLDWQSRICNKKDGYPSVVIKHFVKKLCWASMKIAMECLHRQKWSSKASVHSRTGSIIFLDGVHHSPLGSTIDRRRRRGHGLLIDSGYGSRIDAAKKLAGNILAVNKVFGMFGPGRRKRAKEVVDGEYFEKKDAATQSKRGNHIMIDHGYGSRLAAGSDVATDTVQKSIFGILGPGRR